MSLAPLPKPACCIASSSHFHVVGISVSETVLDTNLRLDGTPEHRRTQIAVCPKTCERELTSSRASGANNNNNNIIIIINYYYYYCTLNKPVHMQEEEAIVFPIPPTN